MRNLLDQIVAIPYFLPIAVAVVLFLLWEKIPSGGRWALGIVGALMLIGVVRG